MKQATTGLMFSSESNEYLTPPHIIDRALAFFGGQIDLDPASNEHSLVPAISAFDCHTDGLKQEWFGRVWLNPPYGRALLPAFIAKAIAEYYQGNVSEILILVPARTDTKWHQSLDSFDRCYLHGRLKFQLPFFQEDRATKLLASASWVNSNEDLPSFSIMPKKRQLAGAPFPSAVFYLGSRRLEFVRCWEEVGTCFSSV